MSITNHMKTLGAPLKNSRNSFGGVREDGAVIIRVWAQDVKGRWVRIYRAVEGDARPGESERAAHIALIRAGARAYAVMGQKDMGTGETKTFDKETVFELTTLRVDEKGHTWAYMASRIPAHQLMA